MKKKMKCLVEGKMEELKKRAPKGVDPDKHERCVKEVKRQGRSVGSAHAICTASMKKSDEVKMPMKEFVKEHKRLLGVLRSPSRKDDKQEAKRQQKEMKEYTEKSEISTMGATDSNLAERIMTHNRAKLHKFVKKQKIKKSIDFQNVKVGVDSTDQLLAEQTASPKLIEYIQRSLAYADGATDVCKVPFVNGVLTLSKKDEGLYNGFFQDSQGQVVEKFDNQTVAIIAKNMIMKNLYYAQTEAAVPVTEAAHADEAEDRALISREVGMALEHHNAIYHKGQEPGEPIKSGKGYIKIRSGDFELEIKKSIRAFITDYKTQRVISEGPVTPEIITKAVKSWRKKSSDYMHLPSDQAAAKEIFNNWDEHQESFLQMVHAQQMLARKGDEE